MSVTEIIEQVKALSQSERKEVAKAVIDLLDAPQAEPPQESTTHWGKNLVQMLEEMGPVELVDSHIEDPVEWVKAQRQKRKDKLKPYWDGEA